MSLHTFGHGFGVTTRGGAVAPAGLAMRLALRLRRPAVPMMPVAVLVLGAAVWPGGVPSPTLRRRALHGASVVLAGRASDLVACGGLGRHPPTEAEAITQVCLAAGVAAARIHPEPQSTTTIENIRFALPILARIGTDRVIVVTDWYHAPRALLVARHMGLRATASCPGLRGTRLRSQIRGVLREIPATLVCLIRLWRQ